MNPKCLLAALAGLPLLASANVMTFEPLTPDFADYNSYTEDGIHFGAVGGGPEVFHADSLLFYGGAGTGAAFYFSDGQPLEVTLASGELFDLISFDLVYLTQDANLRLTSSSGQELFFNASQTINLSPGFEDIAWARFDFEAATPFDGYAVVDNVQVRPVPEASTWSAAGGVVVAALWSLRRRPVRA